jgi:hypothetical protein|tara:strand:+ start:417 stop:2306 length:1890 start_codon:yes stop_codon:yes gene_type:complete
MAADSDYVEGLARLAEQHQQRLSDALVTLEDRIADLMATAPLKDGNLFDLEWAIQSRDALRKVIEEDYLKTVDSIIRDYKGVAASTAKMLEQYGAFTKVSPNTISQLQKLTFQGFDDIGQEYLDVVAKEVYQNTLTGASFVSSVAAVKAVQGGRLAKYAKQQVHDSLMQFDASVNVVIGKESGATHWKYVGRIIETTRPFCRDNEGKVFTDEEIESTWSGSWAGKASGDPFIVRGGYNCGHQFRPVFDEELEGGSVSTDTVELDDSVPLPSSIPELLKKNVAANAIAQTISKAKKATSFRDTSNFNWQVGADGQMPVRFKPYKWTRKKGSAASFQDSGFGTVSLGGINPEALTLIKNSLDETIGLSKKFKVPPIKQVGLSGGKKNLASMGDGLLLINKKSFNQNGIKAYTSSDALEARAALAKAKVDVASKEYDILRKKTSDLADAAKGLPSSSDEYNAWRASRSALVDYRVKYNKLIDESRESSQLLGGQVSLYKRGGNLNDRPWTADGYFDNSFDNVRSTILHEYGHLVHQEYWRKTTDFDDTSFELYLKQLFYYNGKRNTKRGLFFPTKYSEANHKEWWAENFTLYNMGRRDMVDDKLLSLMDAMVASDGRLAVFDGWDFRRGGYA